MTTLVHHRAFRYPHIPGSGQMPGLRPPRRVKAVSTLSPCDLDRLLTAPSKHAEPRFCHLRHTAAKDRSLRTVRRKTNDVRRI